VSQAAAAAHAWCIRECQEHKSLTPAPPACSGKADGVVFEDTKSRGKPIVFIYGTRPFTGGMCPGAHLLPTPPAPTPLRQWQPSNGLPRPPSSASCMNGSP